LQYRPKVNVKKDILKKNTSETDTGSRNKENVNKVQKEDVNKGHKDDGEKIESMEGGARKNANGKWNVNQNVIDSVKISANKFVVLQENYDEEFPPYISPTKQTVVDKYLKYKRKPTKEDVKNEMIIGEFLKENELRNEGNNVLIEGADEHSDGMSHFTSDMQDFQKCVKEIEMEDLNSSGFQFMLGINLHK
ncbi:hypothetical protein Tco_1444431, partial [Tanacetum coccineum]